MIQFNEYFNRQIQLWGVETQKNLQNKKIAIVGCGGLGCNIAIPLGSSGIGEIDLIDFDVVGIHNIHRQIAFTIKDENKKKSEVLKNFIINRSSFVKVNTFDCDFKQFIKTSETKYDLILDATDNLIVRKMINDFSKTNNVPWIYGSVEEFHGHVCFFDKSHYDSVFKITDHKPAGITPPIVMHIASLQANLALRYLANMSVKKDVLYYLNFTNDGLLDTKKFNLPIEK